jgi:hypothetical protein
MPAAALAMLTRTVHSFRPARGDPAGFGNGTYFTIR